MLVGILAGGLAVMWQADIRISSLEKDSLTAFYLAQAGIERAKIEARKRRCYRSGWSSAQALGSGRYYYYIEIWKNRILRSIGQVWIKQKSRGRKRLETKAQNISNPPNLRLPGAGRRYKQCIATLIPPKTGREKQCAG